MMMNNVKARLMEGIGHIMRRQVHKRRPQDHEGASLTKDNQVNNYSKKWRQGYQVMALVVVQVGNFKHGDYKIMV